MTDSSVIANARFQLVERPLIAPGKCAVCGTTERAVVDFGAYVDWFGAIYLCVSCLAEAAATIGMVSAEEHAEAVNSASQSFSSYLIQYDLMVVDSEWYKRAADLFGSLPISDAYIRIVDSAKDHSLSGAEVSGESGPSNGDSADPSTVESSNILRDADATGQNRSTTRNKRSASVPASTGDESDGIGSILKL